MYTNDGFSKSCVSLVKFWEVGGEAPEKILKITMIIEAKFGGIGISGKHSVKLQNQDWYREGSAVFYILNDLLFYKVLVGDRHRHRNHR